MGGLQLRSPVVKGLRCSKELGSIRGEPLLCTPKLPLTFEGSLI